MKLTDFTFFLIPLILITTFPNASTYGVKLDYLGLDNQYHPFESFKGKYLLVDTMATWCGPCILAMPHLAEVQELRKDVLNVFSLSVSPSSDKPKDLAEFKETHNATWEFGIDYDLKFQDAYDVIYIPTYFLFDSDGNLLASFNSTQAQETADYLRLIDPYLPGNYTIPEEESQPLLEIPEVRLAISSVLVASLIVVLIRMVRKIRQSGVLEEK